MPQGVRSFQPNRENRKLGTGAEHAIPCPEKGGHAESAATAALHHAHPPGRVPVPRSPALCSSQAHSVVISFSSPAKRCVAEGGAPWGEPMGDGKENGSVTPSPAMQGMRKEWFGRGLLRPTCGTSTRPGRGLERRLLAHPDLTGDQASCVGSGRSQLPPLSCCHQPSMPA